VTTVTRAHLVIALVVLASLVSTLGAGLSDGR
jgi:hypothetical protein